MRRTSVSWARPLAGALVLLVGLSVSAPPVAAAERPATPKPRTLAAAASAKVAVLPLTQQSLAQASPLPTASTENKSFFKKPAGVASLILMAVGTGYMVHSAFKDNDPVHSIYR